MKIYHGSNRIIQQPNLSKGRRFLDFGSGFYLSDEKGQAENRAKSAVDFFQTGFPTVNVYDFEYEKIAELNVFYFPSANMDWLNFVLDNRLGNIESSSYDIITGPTANDNTILVINQFLDGMFNHFPNPKEKVLEFLQPEKLATQYLFASEKSLKYLHFKENYTV